MGIGPFCLGGAGLQNKTPFLRFFPSLGPVGKSAVLFPGLGKTSFRDAASARQVICHPPAGCRSNRGKKHDFGDAALLEYKCILGKLNITPDPVVCRRKTHNHQPTDWLATCKRHSPLQTPRTSRCHLSRAGAGAGGEKEWAALSLAHRALRTFLGEEPPRQRQICVSNELNVLLQDRQE